MKDNIEQPAHQPFSTAQKSTGKPPDWVRVVMNRDTAQWVNDLNPPTLDVLEISGHKWKSQPFHSYSNTSYPDFDICESIPEERYDLIIAEQVWEHLKYPYRAAKHVLEALRPGGYFLVTVPFLIRSHPTPLDCSRWSAKGLHYFLEECGFDPDSTRADQWGNRACMTANFDHWVRYDDNHLSLANDERFPLVSWALARKGFRAP